MSEGRPTRLHSKKVLALIVHIVAYPNRNYVLKDHSGLSIQVRFSPIVLKRQDDDRQRVCYVTLKHGLAYSPCGFLAYNSNAPLESFEIRISRLKVIRERVV